MERRAESNLQKMPRIRKGGRRQIRGSDAQMMTNERQKERTNKEASQTLDQSAFPSVVSINTLISFMLRDLQWNLVVLTMKIPWQVKG